jgi:hypothetical protein
MLLKKLVLAIEVGKFKMAWIGLIDPKTDKVVPVMISGTDKGISQRLKFLVIRMCHKEGTGRSRNTRWEKSCL